MRRTSLQSAQWLCKSVDQELQNDEEKGISMNTGGVPCLILGPVQSSGPDVHGVRGLLCTSKDVHCVHRTAMRSKRFYLPLALVPGHLISSSLSRLVNPSSLSALLLPRSRRRLSGRKKSRKLLGCCERKKALTRRHGRRGLRCVRYTRRKDCLYPLGCLFARSAHLKRSVTRRSHGMYRRRGSNPPFLCDPGWVV